MATVAQFRNRYPEFATSPDARIQLFLNDALPMFNQARWGAMFDRGHCAYAAHLLALSIRRSSVDPQGVGETAYPVSSHSVGDVSLSFALPTITDQGDGYLASTGYGQDYLSMRDLVGVGSLVVYTVDPEDLNA